MTYNIFNLLISTTIYSLVYFQLFEINTSTYVIYSKTGIQDRTLRMSVEDLYLIAYIEAKKLCIILNKLINNDKSLQFKNILRGTLFIEPM